MSTATGPTNFSNDGRDVIERQVEVKSEKHKNIESLYEIDRTVTKILEGDHKKIALQFPDEFLADAAAVSEQLRIKTDKEIFILADTSYGSCCVDEVAAEHVNADLIVHYGRSCLSPTSRLPVLYVFGQQPIDMNHCIGEFEQTFPNKSNPVVIMCDVEYSYAVDDLTSALQKVYQNIIPTAIQTESKLQSTLSQVQSSSTCPSHEEKQRQGSPCCGRCKLQEKEEECFEKDVSIQAPAQPIENMEELKAEKKKGGRYFELPKDIDIESCSIFFVGAESLTLTNIMMVHNKCPVYTYNPKTKTARKESVQVNKMLMKRYFLVQKAKDAETIGIVVGTLGVGK
ncbi:hypothetical protein G6F35_011794 [Rhizopus arrhizus]|nr:hypothetical protein G6F35_011794 [Rhizopus arrhizus]